MIAARDLATLKNDGDSITPVMRLAAEWLGHKRPWTETDYVLDNVQCPLCTALVPQTAIICPSCRHQIKAMPPELAALQANLNV
jgi:hypothetical protein